MSHWGYNMKLSDKIIIYLYNKQNSLEDEYNEHENYYKYRRKDENDYLESIIALTRKNLINEIIGDIMLILNIPQKFK